MLPLWTLIFGWILTTIIVTGNGLVIYLITTRRNLRTTTNWFVLSLAVADFGFGTFYFPRYASCWMDNQQCANQAVIITYSIGYFFAYASVINICALTLDRYLAIVKPLRYVTFMRKKRVALLIFAAWSVAFLVLILCLILYLAKLEKNVDRTFWLCIAFLSILVCGFLLFATTRIFLIIRGIARQNATVVVQLNFNHRIQHSVAFKARETASAKMIGIVVAIFVSCYLLDTIQTILEQGFTLRRNEILDTIVLPLFKLMNSAVNPVAYAFYKEEIRRELKRMLRRKGRNAAR